MDISNLPAWAFPLFFVGIWILVLTILAQTSGWAQLSEYYGGDSRLEGSRKRFQSMAMGRNALTMVNFSGVATLTVTPMALELATFFPFDVTMKPLVIPLSDLKATRSKQMLFFRTVELKAARAENTVIRLSESQFEWIERESGATLLSAAAS
ncbi:MAG: hypothetical protein AB7F91_11075 [Parvularculaceae bacterium]